MAKIVFIVSYENCFVNFGSNFIFAFAEYLVNPTGLPGPLWDSS